MSKADSRHASMRRMPKQTRGQQRVERILDAAEQLFGDVGYEAATTNEIAGRAGISIGSVYQFFPNKEAILSAVAMRYRDHLAAAYEQSLAPVVATLPLATLATRLVELTLEFGSEHLGFARIVLQTSADPQLAAAAHMLLNEIAHQVEELLRAHADWLSAEQISLYATVGITSVTALLSRGINAKFEGNEAWGHALVEQAKVLLMAYLREVAVRESSNQ